MAASIPHHSVLEDHKLSIWCVGDGWTFDEASTGQSTGQRRLRKASGIERKTLRDEDVPPRGGCVSARVLSFVTKREKGFSTYSY